MSPHLHSGLVATCLLGLATAWSPGCTPRHATILSTASIRGELRPDASRKECPGGFARRAGFIESERVKSPVLLVDGGNFFVPNAEREIDPWGRDQVLWGFMASLGYDAVTPGDLELTYGAEAVKELYSRHPEIQVVSANVRDAEGRLIWPAFTIIEKKGVRFGVTGVIDPSFYAFNVRRGLQEKDEFTFSDPESALQAVLPGLESESDIIVLLLHTGPTEARRMMETVRGPVVGVVGHNPGEAPRAERIGDAWLQRAGNRGGAIGILEMGWEADSLHVIRNTTLRLGEAIPENPQVAERVRRYETWSDARKLLKARLRDAGFPGAYPVTLEDYFMAPGAGAHHLVLRLGDGNRLCFWWEGGDLEPDIRPLRERLGDPREPRPLFVVDDERNWMARRPVSVGSREEETVMTLFRASLVSVFRDGEGDSLLAAYGEYSCCREDLLNRLSPLQERSLRLLALLRFLERQAAGKAGQGPLPYWERRALVYLQLTRARDGRVVRSRLLANYDLPRTGDSLAAAAGYWRFQKGTDAGDETRRATVLTGIPGDRKEEKLASTGAVTPDRLSDAVRDFLNDGALAAWMRVWKDAEREFGPDDFICAPEAYAPGKGPRHRLAGLLSTRLADSTGPRTGVVSRRAWISDPIRFREEIMTWPLSGERVDELAWLDSSTVVLVGWSEVTHPSVATLQVPTVWVGNAKTHAVKRYQGAPVDPRILHAIERNLALVTARWRR